MVKINKYRVEVDRNKCIGCGACESVCKNFKVEEGKSKAINQSIDEKELKNNKEAEKICPVGAIKIKNEN